MDVFVNPVEYEKFRSTNDLWNRLGLNAPSNIGMVSDLINQIHFNNKEEWEEYYYEHGRPKPYLRKVSRVLYNNLPKESNLTFEDCCWCVWFRIIGETWNGIILRENNTIERFKQIYGDTFVFKKTEGEVDANYAVDYEMFFGEKLICGIQIKPTSYNNDYEYLRRAKRNNAEKNNLYENIHNVQVITITSDLNGNITSHDEILKLHNYFSEYCNN